VGKYGQGDKGRGDKERGRQGEDRQGEGRQVSDKEMRNGATRGIGEKGSVWAGGSALFSRGDVRRTERYKKCRRKF